MIATVRLLLRLLDGAAAGKLRLALALMAANSILGALALCMLLPLLRAWLAPQPGQAQGAWLLLFLLLAAASAALRHVTRLQGYAAGAHCAHVLHRRLADKIVRLPLAWCTPRRAGDMRQLASGGVMVVMGAPAHLLQPLFDAVLAPLVVGLLWLAVDWRLGAVLLLAMPPLLFVYRWAQACGSRAETALAASSAEANGRVLEYIAAQPVLRATGRSELGSAMLEQSLMEQRQAERRSQHLLFPAALGFTVAAQLAYALLLAIGLHQVLAGALDVPALLATLIVATVLAEAMAAVVHTGAALQQVAHTLRQFDGVLAERELPVLASPCRVPEQDAPAVEARLVCVRRNGRPIVDAVSLEIAPRSLTVLAGASGSGKTTLLQLLCRQMDPDSGVLLASGVDMRTNDDAALTQLATPMFQHTWLLPASLRDNLSLGRQIVAQDLLAALSAAGLASLAQSLPQGLDTVVGEGGWTLSGGERQRLAFARALLKPAPLMLFDEPLSALDAISERRAIATLTGLARNHAVVVATHRLAIAAQADQILVMQSGRIVERGTYAQLLRLGGVYSGMQRQAGQARGWHLGV
ncbi:MULTISPECIES: ABC transporter ATP-binding protein [unclassified Janthinobacterium]|uniref:ABC transporter ATP-binding protein n=1 Tax=unclassified Janthinobacterium TaxID=2610881 RepID=UPI000891B31A|nr:MULTISPECIES: ABC transporter ATP-binding protein [unclassified Janthinobacterium]SDA86065.1 ATP-binding cassette, subfamily B [Janthinobacterium sp. 551a]SFB66028.1 ATP-binding cassette, subfamily B [Janthinobacterium sp. 344]